MKNNIKTKIRILFAFLLIFPWSMIVDAQNSSVIVYGEVHDQYGSPIQGATVVSENGKNHTITDIDGEYKLIVNDESETIICSFIGYKKVVVAFKENNENNIILETVSHNTDEIIQLGYTAQTKEAMGGAVSSVKGTELEKSPVANFTQTLAGRFSGLTTQETYSEPSRTTTNMYVRGLNAARASSPIVVIDGIVYTYLESQTLDYITPEEIESITVLKDASTEAIYGIAGANGVIVVTTKRGRPQALKITTRYDQSVQQVTTKPHMYSAAEYATLKNEAAFNDGENPFYDNGEIELFRTGEYPDLYSNNNWYKEYMKDFTTQERLGVSATGGNDKAQFYSNINLLYQGGMFKTDQDAYNSNNRDIWVNYRTNVDMKITDFLSTFINLSGNIKKERTPGSSVADVYSSIFNLPPTMYGPVTPQVIDEDNGEIIDKGGEVITTQNEQYPTYGRLNRSGYIRHTVTNINSHVGFKADLDFITDGLSATGVFAYQTNSVGSLSTTQDYAVYKRDDTPTTLEFTQIFNDDHTNTPLGYSKSSAYYHNLSYKISLDYSKSFDLHNITAMAYSYYQTLSKSTTAPPECLPYNKFFSGAEVAYGYANRYFLKLDAGYSGCEQYARGHRYTFTPAVAGAWVVSNEKFMDNVSAISYLKLRGSYGITGNFESGLGRYAYLDNVTLAPNSAIPYLQYTISEGMVANKGVEAETCTKYNVGIDLGLFNELTLSVDLFKERMDNMVISAVSTVPLYQGVDLSNYPSTNGGEVENRGFEISLDYTKRINDDLSFSLGGMVSFARNEVINAKEANQGADYAYPKRVEGYAYGQAFGYLVDYSNGNGFFNSYEDLLGNSNTYSFGTPRVGDLIYKDLNGDHTIDEKDKAPIGFGALPEYTYSFNGTFKYKTFDLSFLFDGVANYSSIYSGIGVSEETLYGGVYGALHGNAWTQERYASGAKITAPALSLGQSTNQQSSDYYNYDRSFLRLRNVELGYNLPKSFAKKIAMDNIRVMLSGQNLLTWDNMKSDDFGPEGSYNSIPVYRVYNLGVSLKF